MRRQHVSLLCACVLAATAACQSETSEVVSQRSAPLGGAWGTGDDEPTDPVDPVDDPDDPDVINIELCDGKDNDHDGAIDEGIGSACDMGDGEAGEWTCIDATMLCAVCTPGETREVDACGCGTQRLDICGGTGRWQLGSCDGCSTPQAPRPCGFCGTMGDDGVCNGGGECEPGDVMFRRCDACPEGETCGATTCIGEELRCASNCTWERSSGCEIRPRECDRDGTMVEPCGDCGSHPVVCDGCFWDRGQECLEAGACIPGDQRTVPCTDGQCEPGFGATVECSDKCEWDEASTCQGCPPGIWAEEVPCVEGAPLCPKQLVQFTCSVSPAENGCNASIGELSAATMIECPPIECHPGQDSAVSCTLPSGGVASQRIVCQNDCTWSPPVEPCGGSCECEPDVVVTNEVHCGCGIYFTEVKRCNIDCKWIVTRDGEDQCPDCRPGEVDAQQCSYASSGNVCTGDMVKACKLDCTWDDPNPSCNPRPTQCTDGETRQEPCSHACGSGHEEWLCQCGSWVKRADCRPDVAPSCTPDATRQVECGPPGCPLRNDRCSESCQWIEGNCPTCG
jgi:hypothetical protein